MSHKGFTLWFTGLSGAGKTTISTNVANALKQRGCRVELLDGDAIRTYLSPGLGFSKPERDTHLRRLGFVAHLLSRNDVIAIVATISPYQAIRDEIRAMTTYVEVYVKASLTQCEQRDVKGLYAKARAGEIKHFTGLDDPYEEPAAPEIICNTEQESADESVAIVLSALEALAYIPAAVTVDSGGIPVC
jgi:adenylylsulfate kinase